MTVQELAVALNKSVADLDVCFDYLGIKDHYKNGDEVIKSSEVLIAVAKLSGFRCTLANRIDRLSSDNVHDASANDDPVACAIRRAQNEAKEYEKRPPVVTVMGHVDHGKTTLLDALRHSRVAASEVGGITQSIGAFSVQLPNLRRITFIDTPGHAAFATMRERGVCATDLVVLVVAADDGFMPQTAECLELIKRFNVPFVIAINKVDKSNADVPGTIQSLLHNGVQIDRAGGDILSVQMSALKKDKISDLLDIISIQADSLDVKGCSTGVAYGIILESKLDVNNGPSATAIIQGGRLEVGQYLVCNETKAKVRKLITDTNAEVDNARLSEPIVVLGWKGVPRAGSKFVQVRDQSEAQRIVNHYLRIAKDSKALDALKSIEKQREAEKVAYRKLLDYKRKAGMVFRKDRSGPHHIVLTHDKPSLPVFIKADTDGAIEAILGVIETYPADSRVSIDIAHFGLGDVSLAEIENAVACDGVIYCFNVGLPSDLEGIRETMGCKIRQHRIIYQLIDALRRDLNERVPPEDFEEVIGKAGVKQIFVLRDKRNKPFTVAGCFCSDGELKRSELFHIERNGQIVHTSTASSMKHHQDDVTLVEKGRECGISLRDQSVSVEAGDTLVCFRTVSRRPEISWNHNF